MFQFFQKRKEAKYAKHRETALARWNDGDKQDAIKELEHALTATPDKADAWCLLGEWSDSLVSEVAVLGPQADASAYKHGLRHRIDAT